MTTFTTGDRIRVKPDALALRAGGLGTVTEVRKAIWQEDYYHVQLDAFVEQGWTVTYYADELEAAPATATGA